MAGDIGVDVQGLAKLAKDLDRIADVALKAEFRKGLTGAGEIVAVAARANASWSERIPGSIHVVTTGSGVQVKAGGPPAPHAVTFEGRVDGGNRRHPVFATGPRGERNGSKPHWTWAEQQARPFLAPALEANIDAAAERVADAIAAAFNSNGWS